MNRIFFKMDSCGLYAVVILLFVTAYVYYGRDFAFETLALGMFLPALVTLFFVENYGVFFRQMVGVGKVILQAEMVFNL